MQQKFNLEAAGRLLGISSGAMRARAKKAPEEYRLERDNRGQLWVWIDPETLPDLKPSLNPSKSKPVQAKPEPLKGAMQADLQGQIDALKARVASAEQRAAVADARAEERARALEAAERNLADLRRLLPVAPPVSASRPWWRFWI